MRRLMLGMLLAAGAAVPTMAAAQMQNQDRPIGAEHHHGGPGGEHPRDQGGRPEGPRAEQPRPAPQAAPPAAQPRPQPAPPQAQVQAQAQGRADGRGFRGDGGFRGDAGYRGNDGNRFGGARVQGDERARADGDPRRFDQGNRPPPPPQAGYRGPQGGPPVAPGSGGYRAQGGPGGYRGEAYGRGPAPQYRQGPGGQAQYRGNSGWSRGWREDRRYDWGGYRAQNRAAFHLPRYYAPRGWGYGYRRFAPGFTLSAVLFDQGFWIGDPFYYRLPPAYGPYRWVRYYNDALLVDIRTGYVVDTVYDIFW